MTTTAVVAAAAAAAAVFITSNKFRFAYIKRSTTPLRLFLPEALKFSRAVDSVCAHSLSSAVKLGEVGNGCTYGGGDARWW